MAKVRIKKFAESATRTYWVSETGNFYSVSKKTKERKILKASYCPSINACRISAPNSDGTIRTYPCKQVVSKAFHPDWEERCIVKAIDGDERNCHVNNLQCISASDHGQMIGKLGGRSRSSNKKKEQKPVKPKTYTLYSIYDGDEKIFVGTREECGEHFKVHPGYIAAYAYHYKEHGWKFKGKYIIKIEGEKVCQTL